MVLVFCAYSVGTTQEYSRLGRQHLVITHMQITAPSKRQGKTLHKMAAAWHTAKCSAQMLSGPRSVSLNSSLLLPRAVLVKASLFHHPLGLGIPDGIVSGSRRLSRCFILVCSKCIIPASSLRLSTLHRDAEDVFLHLNKAPVQSEVSSWYNFKKVQYYLCQTAVIAISSFALRTIYLQMIMEFEVRKKVILTVRSSIHLPQKLRAVE